MKYNPKKIGIIGFGNMGSAIAERIKSKYSVFVFDIARNKTKGLKNIRVSDSINGLVNAVEAIILAVKPQDFEFVLRKIKNYVKDKLIISIAAGIASTDIERYLGRVRIVRVMPNLPVRIGKGMICLCKGKFANQKDLKFAVKLFKKIGRTQIINEDMMDEATAISGSGPGYFYSKMEDENKKEIKNFVHEFTGVLTGTAQEIGFTYLVAKILAETTTEGSFAYLKATRLSPAEAKKQVASRGGTTEAGLEVLNKGGSLSKAVKAALRRAKELRKKIKFIRVG